MRVFNVFGENWQDEETERPGGSFREAWIGERLSAELLGGSLYELRPHSRGWPYHYHHGNEELLIVVAGTPTLRAHNGERVLQPGDCVLFPRGPDGGHTFWNDSDEPVRILMMSTLITPEVVSYPDSGKLGARSPFGGGRFLESSGVEYWEGEE